MKVIVQRCKNALVRVDNEVKGKIDKGYLLLVGFTDNDTEEKVKKMALKITKLRIFEDEEKKLNKDIKEVNGSILSISQFTLYGDCSRGNRPSFTKSLSGELALPLYNRFNDELRSNEIKVETGIFGAEMEVDFINDGPVTIILED